MNPVRSHENRASLWFVGAVQDRGTGQDRYNAAILARLKGRTDVRVLPTGHAAAHKFVRALLNPLVLLVALRRGDRVYASLPGHRGLWLFLATAVVVRLRGLEFFVHHHSFRPIVLGPMRASRALCRIGGATQRHVFLSPGMQSRYGDLYLSAAQRRQSLVVSNAAIAQHVSGLRSMDRTGEFVIGHLCNISGEKGIDRVLASAEAMQISHPDVTFRLAGPIADAGLSAKVQRAVAASAGRVEWLGPVSGEAKAAFYRGIDIFVLPSRLIDEAEPLVMYEAYEAGVLFLATGVGCIPERIIDHAHLLGDDPAGDPEVLRLALARLVKSRSEVAQMCLDHARRARNEANTQLAILLDALDPAKGKR